MTLSIAHLGTFNTLETELADVSFELFVPFNVLTPTMVEQRDKAYNNFIEVLTASHPEINVNDYCVHYDNRIWLTNCEYLDNYDNSRKGFAFGVQFIVWIEDDMGDEIECFVSDPEHLPITQDDGDALKQLILQQLQQKLFE